MSTYFPDKALLLKITLVDNEPVYKIFASWSGSYLSGDSWKINSGIQSVVAREDGSYDCHGYSGSTYNVRLDAEGTTAYSEGVLMSFIEDADKLWSTKIEILPLSDLETLNSVLQLQNGNSGTTSS